jgi:hypothetical protein
MKPSQRSRLRELRALGSKTYQRLRLIVENGDRLEGQEKAPETRLH